ncbi:MAG: ComEA family DNA-binding protein [Steroidobacteraceae bacterium]|jgi:competence protein ComEA|nr:ComEA family DNA-binding protein [Steroidobacteraceae bacterium]
MKLHLFRNSGACCATFLALVLQLGLPLAALAGPVNVNTADAQTLARELQGIGLAKAQAIVAHREKHGAFRSIADLARVRGIGEKTLERNRDYIRLDSRPVPAGARPAAPSAATAPGGTRPAPMVRPGTGPR